MNEQLIASIKQRIDQGQTKEEIKDALLSQGHYDDAAIEAAYAAAHTDQSHEANDTAAAAGDDETAGARSELVSYWGLIEQAVQITFAYPRLIGGAVVAAIGLFALLAILGIAASSVAAEGGILTGLASTIIYIVSTLGFALIGWSVISGLLHRETEPGFWSNFQSLTHQIVPVIVIVVLVQLAVSGAVLALVLPAIALSIYITFSFHSFLTEERRSFTALLRSIDLVYGHWWAVALRMLALGLLVMVVMFVGAFALALVPFIGVVLLPVLWLWGVFVMSAGSVLIFESLQVSKPAAAFDPARYGTVQTLLYIACALGALVMLFQFIGMADTPHNGFYPGGFNMMQEEWPTPGHGNMPIFPY